MVTSPDDGAIPSVSIGFVGLYGTIAGMSARGITGNNDSLPLVVFQLAISLHALLYVL